MSVADTSRTAFERIASRRSTRQRLILFALETWEGTPPTAYELFMRLRAQGAVRDLNDVRPRLTELKADGRVLEAGTRACTITGRSAHTWRPAPRAPQQSRLWSSSHDLAIPTPEDVGRHKKRAAAPTATPTTTKGGTAMNSASVANRPVDRPAKSDHPKKGPWAVGAESDERIAIIADALNLFDDGRSRSGADTAISTQWATRAYVGTRVDGPYAHADAVARHRAVAAAQAKAAEYRGVLSEADRHLVALIALRSLDTYHQSLEGFHGPPGGDARTWRAMDAARQAPVRADLEHAWYHHRCGPHAVGEVG